MRCIFQQIEGIHQSSELRILRQLYLPVLQLLHELPVVLYLLRLQGISQSQIVGAERPVCSVKHDRCFAGRFNLLEDRFQIITGLHRCWIKGTADTLFYRALVVQQTIALGSPGNTQELSVQQRAIDGSRIGEGFILGLLRL